MKRSRFRFAALAIASMLTIASCSLQGPQGEQGAEGEKGEPGEPGRDGSDGQDGASVLSGSGAPNAGLGKQGDLYVDTLTGDLYSRSEYVWVKTGNIRGSDGKNGRDGKDGVSILGVAKTSSSGNVDTYTITYSDGSKSTFKVTNGKDGPQGAQGEKGADGHTPTVTIGSNGNWFVDGQDTGFSSKGEKGEAGQKGQDGKDGVSIVSVTLQSSDGLVNHYVISYSDGSESYFDIRNGQDGKEPVVTIDSNGNWAIDGVDTGVSAKGERGDDGVSITEVTLNSEKSDETKSVYTIHYSNGGTSEFVVANGKDGLTPHIGENGNWWVGDVDTGVAAQGPKGDKGDKGDDGEDGVSVSSILKTSTDGNVDTYTITYSDGSTSSFTVTNGKDGSQGIQGEPGKDGHSPTISIGENGDWYIDGEDTGISAKGAKGDKGEKGDKGDAGKDGVDGKDGVSVVNSYIDENGDLICELSNGQKINAGHVKDVTKHTVTFHVDDEIVSTIQVENGAKISRPSDNATAGYTINSWHVIDENGETFDWAFPIYKVEEDLDLYADYKGNEYTVSFVDETYGKTADPITFTYDMKYTLPKLTGVDGYSHVNWKTKDGASYGFSGKWRTASDVTLYAEWKNNEYTVTLDPAKGSISVSTVSVTYDELYSLPTPERLNYIFLGWYDGSGKLVSQNATWKRTKNEKLTARWTNVTNTYVFDPGDGTCEVTSMVIGWDDEYELPEAVSYFNKNFEYQFDGWYLGDVKIPQKGTWTYSNAGGTLTAKYSESIVYRFGSYPQSKVTNSSVLSSLSAFERSLPTPTDSKDWTSYYGYYTGGSSSNDFMWYKDVESGGKRYRGVYFTSYRQDRCISKREDEYGSLQDNNGYTAGHVYWFEWEPVKWKTISFENGEYMMLSDLVLDSQQFYHSSTADQKTTRCPYDSDEGASVYDSNYRYSDIRRWLNTDFYDACLKNVDSGMVAAAIVDNSRSDNGPGWKGMSKYTCEDTKDKVFLLNFKEAYYNDYWSNSSLRSGAYATDYAKCQGSYVSEGDKSSPWWLRSPYDGHSNWAGYVSETGKVTYYNYSTKEEYSSIARVYRTDNGVRPAIRLRLD